MVADFVSAEKACARCGAKLVAYAMSYFNTDDCCLQCLDDEAKAPTYSEARRVELEEVARGNTKYRGRGLQPEDVAFLRARLAERGKTWVRGERRSHGPEA